MSEPIIGLDLGNYYLQPCFIQGFDPITRRGGRFYDLVDPALGTPYGIPTAFFYSQRRGVICGEQAVKAVPVANCVRYLKRDLFNDGKPNKKTIDGKTFSYDEMIVAAAQYGIRLAAKYLERELNTKTNKIALAYPASMSLFEKNHLVALLQEKVTLEDGRKIEIVGTIAEPAAAALDYLACENITDEETALVSDLGAGTFDVSIVKVYPNGRVDKDGNKYYYDVKCTDGIDDLGGKEFDEVVRKINLRNAGEDANDAYIAEQIRVSAEPIKRELTFEPTGIVQPQIMLRNGDFIKEITRDEFEKESKYLVERMLKMVEDTINKNSDVTINHMILTGGASQMPIIKRMFEERFPKYRKIIKFHMPSKAIASGAARFGIDEGKSKDDKGVKTSTVVIRTIRDLGTAHYKDKNDNKGFIVTYIKAGTPIPVTSEWEDFYKLGASEKVLFSIYEGKTSSPNEQERERDYRLVHDHYHYHGQKRPVDYRMQSRIVIDEKHLAYLEVREPDNPSMGIKTYPFTVDYK